MKRTTNVCPDLLNSNNSVIILIQGEEVCTEEAAMVFEGLSFEQRSKFLGLSDRQIIESIYALFFNYGFTNTHGVEKFSL